MGNSKSKIKVGSRGKIRGKTGHNGRFADEHQRNQGEEYEDTELLLLRRAIDRDPESFVLNNLMMCVQFFGNYEEEIEHVKETMVSSQEAKLNERLPPQKHVLLPDVLQEHISRNVGFTSSRQTFRPIIEPLHPVRIYTVHDNIDITEQNYSSHYSNVNDSTMYNILLKPTDHQGYVQLQLLDDFGMSKRKTINEDEMDLSSIAENDDEFYSDGESIYGLRLRPKASNYSMSSGKSQQEFHKGSNYGHAKSLPNLHEEQVPSDNRSVKAETDYENDSSNDERTSRNKRAWSKGESSKRANRRSNKQSSQIGTKESSVQEPTTSSNSSGYRSDNLDSDSSFNLNRNFRLSQTLNDEELEELITSAKLPDHCFKKVTYSADGKLYDPREEKKQLVNSKQRRIKLALRRHNYDLFYASSTEFMKHFINVFVNRLGESFGFDKESLEDTRREGCVLYCDQIMISNEFKYGRIEQYEIMPSIWLQWPNCAQEWLDRPRSTWPDYADVEKIKDFGCYVVPEGFVPKKGNSNIMADLEWQLTFPTAERYLETCMTQSQVQVYFIALMLHKTFIRPVFDTMFGMTAAHIRHKLFWMIEENDRPSKWPDTRMGECLLFLLNSLYHNISQNEPTLKDYFISDRNLFQRVPCEHLLHTQKQLKRIIENPVMYVFHAMENIRHSDNFFPRLDYEMLLKILTADTLTLVNPALTQRVSRPMPRPRNEQAAHDDKYAKMGFWDTVKNQPKKHSVQSVNHKMLINPRKATDCIIEITTRCEELEGPRLCVLLDFFVRHFIKIAERCNQYRAYRQKTVYLDHADRLSILLFEQQRFKEDARAYRDKIKVLRKKMGKSEPRDDVPVTPKRNAETAVYVASLKNRFVSESSEQIYSSPRTSDVEPRSDGEIDHDRNVTTAVVHETRNRHSKERILTPITETITSNSATTRSSSSGESESPQSILPRIKLSESPRDESTYI
ncbi:uncharacterized protein LOC105662709 isoform X1 [Megachile rotundata]|uniref:uncharacterized protein LOC105662709 isoform X1 n=2 Tax=Megachile rotundata TaxID=143995 RepID=UPI000614FFFF|nr:PREDICTED: uncharacterized protein LOC105662709 isoform X1 [Megachile rotundata]XP_012142686.1 PREDICTED: uncharacterized protein LOC105662709 isoform X1 [Megachile rotundata]